MNAGQYVSHHEIADNAVPTDRTFRTAWTPNGNRIDVGMPKARNIHRDRMRTARKPMLEALDVEYQRADEIGDAAGKADVAARKQALRDIPAHPGADPAGLSQQPPIPTADQTAPTNGNVWSLKDLLERADEAKGEEPVIIPPIEPPSQPIMAEPLPHIPADEAEADATRKRAAKGLVRRAVADVNRVTNEQQIRFEGALMAKNKNMNAMEGLGAEARVHGITVEQLADRIIAERLAREQRAYQVHAVEAQALKDIDAASGDAIEEPARQAIASIERGV